MKFYRTNINLLKEFETNKIKYTHKTDISGVDKK